MKGRQIKLGIIGAGAWGTALAVIANRAGTKVHVWSRNENVLNSIEQRRVNDIYLPDVFLDTDIGVSNNLADVCACDYVLLSVPAQYMRPLCISISDLVDSSVPLIIASKGIERGSLSLMSEVVESILPNNPVAVLSGPNFALEAASGLPTATTVACESHMLADKLLYLLGGKYFRPYHSEDIIGTQIGGAVKNVIAIASGICMGRNLGENARTALITRGLREMMRLSEVKGGTAKSLMGLAGMGDLMLTCNSLQSRNTALGASLGEGKSLKAILPNKSHGLTEGVHTAESVHHIAQKLGVHMPICETVYEMLYDDLDTETAIERLLGRPFSVE